MRASEASRQLRVEMPGADKVREGFLVMGIGIAVVLGIQGHGRDRGSLGIEEIGRKEGNRQGR
jgi:hypothetical protein